MLEIKNLSFRFGEKKILHNISYVFGKGKVVGILGKNGAGKTTLFRNIIGWYQPYEGEILLNSEPIQKQDVSFLETEPYFYPYMKGKEYLQLVHSEKEKEMNLYADILNIPLDRLVENYSTGMKKKLAFIATLLQNRSVIILDEPFNGVDIESNEIFKKIIEKEKENKIILLSSHILGTLLENCDEVCYLKEGQINATFPKIKFEELQNLFKGEIKSKLERLI